MYGKFWNDLHATYSEKAFSQIVIVFFCFSDNYDNVWEVFELLETYLMYER